MTNQQTNPNRVGRTLEGRTTPVTTAMMDRWSAEWEASSDLQNEFPTAAAYVAIKKREKR
jgi:hypothetical protein